MGRKHTIFISLLFIGSVISLHMRDARCPSTEDPFNPTHLSHPNDCKVFRKTEFMEGMLMIHF